MADSKDEKAAVVQPQGAHGSSALAAPVSSTPPQVAQGSLLPSAPTGFGRARGLVSSRVSGRRVEANSYQPAPDLADAVMAYWVGRWELPPEAPHVSELLSDPCVHIVVEGGDRSEARVVGVWTRLWRRTLHGVGWVRGVKLRAGAVRTFIGLPAASLSNRIVPCTELFGAVGRELERAVHAQQADIAAFDVFARWLRQQRRSELAAESRLVIELVERAARDGDITTADGLASSCGLSLRSLQRLFREHVGASPKWVIRRYRLQEVALRLEAGETRSLAALAAELGYSDQAHLTKDFKNAVGKSPREFATLVHE